MKLWQKDKDALAEVNQFTVGRDREMDTLFARFDVIGSLAHIEMLESVGLLTRSELTQLTGGLKAIHRDIVAGRFSIAADVEDIHSQVELLLTQKLGDVGKKIHSGRSRNDQVLVDLRLFLRQEIRGLVELIAEVFALLQAKSEEHKGKLLPGYTHLQLAMPSSFGLWFGAYAESLVDDLIVLNGAYRVVNKNPLGSAAGYGSSFPLNRTLTTELLGFDDLNYNVVYAQMGRGKTEKIVANALTSVAGTLAKLAMDVCLFLNQNFGFISFPEEVTTGSSIMPHKKNPDVFELIRGKCNVLQGLPGEIAFLTTNLPSGYHRDLQLLKEKLFPAFGELRDCLRMTAFMLSRVTITPDLLKDKKYDLLFSVEEVNKQVVAGVPFRDAYKKVGADIAAGSFAPDKNLKHTHEGSMGNLGTSDIRKAFEAVQAEFAFEKAEKALNKLLAD